MALYASEEHVLMAASIRGDQAVSRLARVWRRVAADHRSVRVLGRAVRRRTAWRFPNELTVAVEWAQQATESKDWREAVCRWGAVLDRFDVAAPPKAYARLATAYRQQRHPEVAESVLEWGCARFPGNVRLAMDWAQLATAEKQWPEAVARWQAVLENFPELAPVKAHVRLATALREQGDLERAAAVLQGARARFPDEGGLAVEWAQLAFVAKDWPEAVERLEYVLDRFEDVAPAKVFALLAAEYRHQEAIKSAAAVIERGRSRFPRDVGLAVEWAHLAMVEAAWPEAIRRWQDVMALTERGRGSYRLPARAPNLDWHEGAWTALAQAWPEDVRPLGFTPSVSLYDAVARVLGTVGAADSAARVLRLGLQQHPGHPRLRFELLAIDLDQKRSRPGSALDARQLAEILGPPPSAHRRAQWSRKPAQSSADAARNLQRNADALARFVSEPATGSSLSRIHRIRVPRGSTIELQVRAGRFYNQSVADERVRELSERENWPEIGDGPNPVAQLARRLSDSYGHRFQQRPYLAAAVLADAVYPVLSRELLMHRPMLRLAEAIADEPSTEPVFIEIAGAAFVYGNGYADRNLGPLYLYFELRRLKVNAFLVQFTDHEPGVSPTASGRPLPSPFTFSPSRFFTQGSVAVQPRERTEHRAAIIPAGMRSVEDVAARLHEPLLYASGSLMRPVAYDRLSRTRHTIRPEATIHPPRSLMRTVNIALWQAAKLVGTYLEGGSLQTAEAPIDVSAPLDKDWLGWLDHVLGQYLEDLSRRSYAEITVRGIKEAHVSDQVHTESSVFAGAVKAAGGRVVLWPHSANPVDADARRAASFDVVHAVTRAGCDQWRDRFPHAEVVQAASLMLSPPRADSVVDERLPLSVVVLGGRSAFGSTALVHQTRYRESYRRFFAGLEELQRHLSIDVYYKPKGRILEHEAWLQHVVGDTASWQRTLEHPLQMTLPNMVFVSVAVGSTALLEGLSRGIPCLIVRDFPARDYTTLTAGAIPIGPSAEMLEVVRSCAEGGRQQLVERQTAYYLWETEGASPVHS
jgi:tetratricopeptide (TPR) repeat protein